jgi:hypothetical protein
MSSEVTVTFPSVEVAKLVAHWLECEAEECREDAAREKDADAALLTADTGEGLARGAAAIREGLEAAHGG